MTAPPPDTRGETLEAAPLRAQVQHFASPAGATVRPAKISVLDPRHLVTRAALPEPLDAPAAAVFYDDDQSGDVTALRLEAARARPSILSPAWRARRAPEPAASPVELPAAEVSPERLAAMLAREGRSVLSRGHVPFDATALPATVVREAVPVRSMSSGAVPLPSRMPARERPSVLAASGPTPILYPRERP